MLRRTALALGTAMVALMAGVGAASAATPDDTFVMAKQIDDIISLDPAEVFEFSGNEIITNIYDRADDVRRRGTSPAGPRRGRELVPSATTARPSPSRSAAGLTFHSGNPVTAEDAACSLQRVIKLDKTPAFILTQFGLTKDNVDEMVKATDDSTLASTLDENFAPTFVLNCLTAGRRLRRRQEGGDGARGRTATSATSG